MRRDNCVSFVSRVERSGFSRESLYPGVLRKRGSVRAQTSLPSPRPSRPPPDRARLLYPTIHLSAHFIDHARWMQMRSALPFTRASGTLCERITDFHRAALYRGACGRGMARPGSFMLERVIEISCNVIIAHSPFRSPSRYRPVASRGAPDKERAMHRDRVIREHLARAPPAIRSLEKAMQPNQFYLISVRFNRKQQSQILLREKSISVPRR